MKVEGNRIYLQAITEEHTPLIVRWRNNPLVRKNFIIQVTFTEEMHNQWLQEKVKTGQVIQFIIYLRETDTPIGSVYLRDVDHKNEKAEFGILIGEDDQRGRGYGREAAELICRYGFDQVSLHKIMLRVYAWNQPTIRSYKKAGFVQEAYLKDEVKNEKGFQDIILMAKINDEE